MQSRSGNFISLPKEIYLLPFFGCWRIGFNFSNDQSRHINMPNRFEKVIQQASKFPNEIQDEIVGQWMEDIKNEMKWQQTLQ